MPPHKCRADAADIGQARLCSSGRRLPGAARLRGRPGRSGSLQRPHPVQRVRRPLHPSVGTGSDPDRWTFRRLGFFPFFLSFLSFQFSFSFFSPSFCCKLAGPSEAGCISGRHHGRHPEPNPARMFTSTATANQSREHPAIVRSSSPRTCTQP